MDERPNELLLSSAHETIIASVLIGEHTGLETEADRREHDAELPQAQIPRWLMSSRMGSSLLDTSDEVRSIRREMAMGDRINVVLIVVDTLRADHLGCYGYFRDTTPCLDRLAREGVLFRDSHASAIPTGPGFSSIITGLSPIHHHLYLTPYNLPNLIDFDDGIPTLPELIQDVVGGYTTAAFDNLINFKSHMGQFVRGFEYYVNASRTAKPIHHHLVGGAINERLIPWLRTHSENPFFLFAHYWDPHTPYNQPDQYRAIYHHEPGCLGDLQVREAPAGYSYVPGWGRVGELWEPALGEAELTLDLYDGEIRYTDHLIQEVVNTLEELGLGSRTVVIVTSDHGEQLGQHGMYGHGMLHEAVIWVPLIMWGPGSIPAGQIIEGYVQHADIAPTILALLGAEQEELPAFDGISLLSCSNGQRSPREEIFIEDHHYRAVMQGPWKYSLNYFQGLEELYDVDSDPMEVVNHSASESGRCDEMRKRLENWVRDNLRGERDPMWAQVARTAAAWDASLRTPFPGLRP
jgi:arylsulfatase